ncbi:hypothetical protein HDU96_002000 [Phlyctochytrium bullatum]|nr:hypothetical protein HDU96_002000 [Phlyctochytrium bullatum]
MLRSACRPSPVSTTNSNQQNTENTRHAHPLHSLSTTTTTGTTTTRQSDTPTTRRRPRRLSDANGNDLANALAPMDLNAGSPKPPRSTDCLPPSSAATSPDEKIIMTRATSRRLGNFHVTANSPPPPTVTFNLAPRPPSQRHPRPRSATRTTPLKYDLRHRPHRQEESETDPVSDYTSACVSDDDADSSDNDENRSSGGILTRSRAAATLAKPPGSTPRRVTFKPTFDAIPPSTTTTSHRARSSSRSRRQGRARAASAVPPPDPPRGRRASRAASLTPGPSPAPAPPYKRKFDDAKPVLPDGGVTPARRPATRASARAAGAASEPDTTPDAAGGTPTRATRRRRRMVSNPSPERGGPYRRSRRLHPEQPEDPVGTEAEEMRGSSSEPVGVVAETVEGGTESLTDAETGSGKTAMAPGQLLSVPPPYAGTGFLSPFQPATSAAMSISPAAPTSFLALRPPSLSPRPDSEDDSGGASSSDAHPVGVAPLQFGVQGVGGFWRLRVPEGGFGGREREEGGWLGEATEEEVEVEVEVATPTTRSKFEAFRVGEGEEMSDDEEEFWKR